MRDLAESFLSFSWAVSLYGARQAAAVLGSAVARPPADQVAASFDHVAWSAERQLESLFLELFQAGNALQNDGVDLAWNLLPSDLCSPAEWLSAGAELAGSSAETARFALPGTAPLAWRELANKVQVYLLVKRVSSTIGVPPRGEPFPLDDLVERCYGLGTFPALWAVEGLGHDYADHLWPDGGPPSALLTGPAAAGLPAKSSLMLHAGIGLSFAQRLLARLPPDAPAAEVRRTVAEFVRLCHDNARPGAAGAALESLGLVTRTFHPRLMPAVAAAVAAGAPPAAGYFWHGVGRALYFLPVNFLPVGEATWRPFAMALDEAGDELAYTNLYAGLGWAFTLVNMRQPRILERLLLAEHGAELASSEGFANGVASAVMMRHDTTPDDPVLAAFLAHRPAGGRWWDELVREPAAFALENVYPELKAAGRLGEMFRFQPPARPGRRYAV